MWFGIVLICTYYHKDKDQELTFYTRKCEVSHIVTSSMGTLYILNGGPRNVLYFIIPWPLSCFIRISLIISFICFYFMAEKSSHWKNGYNYICHKSTNSCFIYDSFCVFILMFGCWTIQAEVRVVFVPYQHVGESYVETEVSTFGYLVVIHD